MTLEDFFTLTEMKDGLTAPARVEELVSVMNKEKYSLVKNVGDATRQWVAVASTITATENKECLDLFVQLDGLWFIDRWLKNAQTFATERSDCFVEETISALLQAVEKLQIDNERLISSGICITVKSLLSYNSVRVQDRARTLFDNWKAKDVDLISMGVEKSAFCDDDQKVECIEVEMIKLSKYDQVSSQKSSDHADSRDVCPDTVASAFKLKCVEGDISVREEASPSDGKLDPQCSSDPKRVAIEVSSEVLKFEHVVEEARHENKIDSVRDWLGKVEVSSASDSMGTEKASAKPDQDAKDAMDDLSVKSSSRNDTNRRCKSHRKYFGNTREFARLTKNSKNSVIIRQTDMDLEDGTVDALEVARLVAKEVEREVVGYDEQSGSSSDDHDESISRDSPESINGGQDPDQEKENVCNDASEKDCSVDMQDIESSQVTDPLPEQEVNTEKSICEFDLNQEFSSEDLDDNHHQVDTISISNPVSVVSAPRAVLAPGMPAGPIQFEGSLGWRGSAATSAFRLPSPRCRTSDSLSCMETGMSTQTGTGMENGNSPKFKGGFGCWDVPKYPNGDVLGTGNGNSYKLPCIIADSEKALSGGATSSGSRSRQGFLDFDLNVAEAGDDKIINPILGLPSGESSVELSPKRYERLKFDLNLIGEDGNVSSPASSSCMHPSVRNFDLNDNPASCNKLSDEGPFLGESSSHNVISILGTNVKKDMFPPQTALTNLPFPNERTSEPLMVDASLLRGGALVGLGPAVPYGQSVYGYNGLAMGPVVSFPTGPTYGPGGPIPYMFDSREVPVNVMPQIPPSYCQSPLVMNIMGATATGGSYGAVGFCPNLDLNSGYGLEGGNRDPAFFRQIFIPGQGRPLEEQLRDTFRPSAWKRKEPDNGWELYPTNYKHHQPPYL